MTWIGRKVFLASTDKFDDVILTNVNPLFTALEAEGLVESFHFLRYVIPDEEEVFLRVRALTDEDSITDVEQQFNEHLDHSAITRIEDEGFTGHVDRWGERIWKIIYQDLEYSSKTALRIIGAEVDGDLRSPEDVEYDLPISSDEKAEKEVFLERHSHFLANQIGYSSKQEARFHQIQAVMKGLSPNECIETIKQIFDTD